MAEAEGTQANRQMHGVLPRSGWGFHGWISPFPRRGAAWRQWPRRPLRAYARRPASGERAEATTAHEPRAKAAQLGSGGRRERGGDASREPQTEARRAVAARSAEVTRAASCGQSSKAAARGAPVCACAERRAGRAARWEGRVAYVPANREGRPARLVAHLGR